MGCGRAPQAGGFRCGARLGRSDRAAVSAGAVEPVTGESRLNQLGRRLIQVVDLALEVPAGTHFNVDGELVEAGPVVRFSVRPSAYRLVNGR